MEVEIKLFLDYSRDQNVNNWKFVTRRLSQGVEMEDVSVGGRDDRRKVACCFCVTKMDELGFRKS